MILNKIPIQGLIATVLSVCSPVVCGCSDDAPGAGFAGEEEGMPADVTLSFSTLRSGTEEGETAGDGTPSNPDSEKEKIDSWWIAFVDREGKVRQLVSRTATGAVEMETFTCTVPSGVYSLYAFANITAEELKTASGVEFTVGSDIKLPAGIDTIEDAVWNTSLNGWDINDKYLPMTGILKDVRIRGRVEETFSIEVVRMAAKMELRFSNLSTNDITVNGVTLDPVTTSAISLFPKGESGIGYSHLGHSPFSPLAGAEYGNVIFTLGTGGNTVAAGTPADKPLSKTIYLQESLSTRQNDGAFTIGLNVTHKDGVNEYEQHNITHDILSYINRNDHIVIPVTLSRYAVDIDAVFYPPIGGYPTAASSVDPDGSQIFTFSTEGDFAIVPRVTDKQTGLHTAPVYYKVEVGEILDPTGIFSSAPAVVAGSPGLPEEVTGILTEATGRAKVKVTVSIYDKPRYEAEAKITDTYTRTLYIIRD